MQQNNTKITHVVKKTIVCDPYSCSILEQFLIITNINDAVIRGYIGLSLGLPGGQHADTCMIVHGAVTPMYF